MAAEYKRNISQIQVLKHGKKFAVVPTNQVKAEKAEIYVDGRLEYVYPLQEEQKLFFVNTPIGGVNVEIKDKKIRVTTSNSPLKLCVKQGWIDGVGESIIGVPDRLLIQIVGENDEDYVDGVVR